MTPLKRRPFAVLCRAPLPGRTLLLRRRLLRGRLLGSCRLGVPRVVGLRRSLLGRRLFRGGVLYRLLSLRLGGRRLGRLVGLGRRFLGRGLLGRFLGLGLVLLGSRLLGRGLLLRLVVVVVIVVVAVRAGREALFRFDRG